MKYIDLYKLQIDLNFENRDKAYDNEFFNEYVDLNCFLNDANRSKTRITEIIKEDIENLNSSKLIEIDKIVAELLVTISDVVKLDYRLFRNNKIEGVVFLIGDGTVDSHGVVIDNKSYLLIDVLAYLNGKDFYNPYSFIVHEYTHCIHYKLNSEMYFRNFKNRVENVLKRLIIEGFATYITKIVTGEKDYIVFWLGYLDEYDVENWMRFSRENQHSIGAKINELIDEDTYRILFSVCNKEYLWKGRLAYYYGYKIAEILSKKYRLEELLELPYERIRIIVEDYFS
ncbi:MAG: hypothetical protein K8R73_11620 [Clostridiales bacterium]|nr:hypothetical protein [Clostridiales bacterium]